MGTVRAGTAAAALVMAVCLGVLPAAAVESEDPAAPAQTEPDPAEPAQTDPEPTEPELADPAPGDPYEEGLPDPYEIESPEPFRAPGADGSAEPDTDEDPEALSEAEAEAAARLDAERTRVARLARAELERAQARLAQAASAREAALSEQVAARAEQEALAKAHGAAVLAGQDARRDLGNLVRQAYTSGPSEWTLIASFLDADGPTDALRRASLSTLLAERQDSEWDAAVATVDELAAQQQAAGKRLAQAEAAALTAQEQYETAADQVAGIQAALEEGGITGTDGAAEVQRICGDADTPLCQPSGWGESQLTRDAVWLMRTVRQEWPQIEDVGGYRPVDAYPDHPTGRAVDVMVPDAGRSEAGAAVGDEIAAYFMEHADEYGVMYIIWDQKIWGVGRDPIVPVDQWRQMSDRGDWTSNHMDHVHITVSTGVSGSNIYSVIDEARSQAG